MPTQPEQVFEDNLVAPLTGQGYGRSDVRDEESMPANLKAQLEKFNGLPLVQIELKRRGLEMKEAFNQINRYQRYSYWI